MGQGNRGMALENLINYTNEGYRMRNIAVIYKRPTPIKVLRSQGNRITSAVWDSKSTVDFQGVYRGHSLEFEAKSTNLETRFEFKNIHEHQINHMRSCTAHGAICFVILEFSKHSQIFYLPSKMILDAWDDAKKGCGRHSLPYDDIARSCYLLKSGRGVPLDYLAVVDKLLEKEVS